MVVNYYKTNFYETITSKQYNIIINTITTYYIWLVNFHIIISLSLHCIFTVTALHSPCHCHCHCHCMSQSLPLYCHCTMISLHCIFTVTTTASSLSLYYHFTATSLSLHCQCHCTVPIAELKKALNP